MNLEATFVRNFEALGVTTTKYLFGEGEKKITDEEEEKAEERNDQFRPEPILVKNSNISFAHPNLIIKSKFNTQEANFSYFISDNYYLSYINLLKKVNLSEDKLNNIMITYNNLFFKLFGFSAISLSDQINQCKQYLQDISIRREENWEEAFAESEREWSQIQSSLPIENNIVYKKVGFDNCQFESYDGKFDDIILFFHNYGIAHRIMFTFTIFYANEEQIFESTTFSVGKRSNRNQCFVTILRDSSKNKYVPYILESKVVETKTFAELSNTNYASYIDGIKRVKMTNKRRESIMKTYESIFFNLFGLSAISLVDKMEDCQSYLSSLSRVKNSKWKDDSQKVWSQIKDKIPIDKCGDYKEINIDNCNFENEDGDFSDIILFFHNYGIEHNITFTVTIFYTKNKQIFGSTTFSIGDQSNKNRCFATILKDNVRNIYIPCIIKSSDEEPIKLIDPKLYYSTYISELTYVKMNQSKLDNIMTNDNAESFFSSFGFNIMSLVDEDEDENENDNENSIDYLNGLSNIVSVDWDEVFRVSENIWSKIHKLITKDNFVYKRILYNQCDFENEDGNFNDIVLFFHNYGVAYQITFRFTVLYTKNDEEKVSMSTNFIVGDQSKRKECIITILKDNEKDIYIPYILVPEDTKIFEFNMDSITTISNQLFLFSDEYSNVQLYNNNYSKSNQFTTHIYDIKVGKINHPIEFEIEKINDLRVNIQSIFKLNLLLEKRYNLKPSLSCKNQFGYFINEPTSSFSKSKEKNPPFILEINNTSNKTLAYISFDNRAKKNFLKFTETFGDFYEYKIFVGLKGVKYSNSIASHISLYSSFDLISVYVDDNLNKIYCVFVNDKITKFVEGDFGTQNVDDMTVIHQFDYVVQNPEFEMNELNNNLSLKVLDSNEKVVTFQQNLDNDKWTKIDDNTKKTTKKSTGNNEEKIDIPNEEYCTAPVALEINNKLFILSKKNSLFHPAWNNSILKHSIISTFYRFATNLLPDQYIFNKDAEDDANSAIIYPQIDIGYRGNIRYIFGSSNSPGIFEYCSNSFIFTPYKEMMPYFKTDALFFNNGSLKVGLDKHRTRSQIAASSLFAFACTIYGPEMRIRDFVFERGSPYSKKDFNKIHHLLIAAYGTLLKISDKDEFEFALNVIAEELGIPGNVKVYHTLMKYLEENNS